MTQVILIENNKALNDLISINLTTYLGVDLIQRNNAQEALSLLAILPSIDLIITSLKTGEEETAKIISDYISNHRLESGLIVLGTKETANNDFTLNIENTHDWEKVVHGAAKILGINENILAKKIKIIIKLTK